MAKKYKKRKKLAIEKVKAPPKEHPEYNYVGVLLESVKDDFRAFGENLDLVREKTDATFEEVGKLKVQMTEMNMRMDSLEREVKSIKGEIKEIKTMLTKKADLEKISALEKRINRIEEFLKMKGYSIA